MEELEQDNCKNESVAESDSQITEAANQQKITEPELPTMEPASSLEPIELDLRVGESLLEVREEKEKAEAIVIFPLTKKIVITLMLFLIFVLLWDNYQARQEKFSDQFENANISVDQRQEQGRVLIIEPENAELYPTGMMPQ